MLKKIVAITLIVVSLFAVNCFMEKPTAEKELTTIIYEYDCDFDEVFYTMALNYENIVRVGAYYDWDGTEHRFVELKVSPDLGSSFCISAT